MNGDFVRFGKLLQALRQYYACPCDRSVCNHDLAKRNPDANRWADFINECCIVIGIGKLECQGARYAVRCSCELGDQGISAQLMGDSTVALDRLRETLERILDSFVRNALVPLYKASRINHIGVEDDSKL